MRFSGSLWLFVGGAAALTCPALHGTTIIYTTGGTPPTFSSLTQNAWSIGPGQTFTALAESFIPASTQNLGQIDLPLQLASGAGNVLVRIASNSGGNPGSILESFTTTAPASETMVSLASVTLPQLIAGNTYWLVLTATGTLDVDWFVSIPRGVDIQIGGGWVSSSGSSRGAADILAANPAPEPASLSLVAIALAVGLILRCVRRIA